MIGTNSSPETRKIIPPSDFPVTWRKPQDAQLHWTRDREHMPDPITPMFNSAASTMATESRNRAAAAYDEPIVQRHDQTINTYNYTSLVPFQGTPDELDARARHNRDQMRTITARLSEVWEREWRPELEAHWAFWTSFNLERADLPALLAHLEESLTRGSRMYEIHYRMGPPMWFAIDEFVTFYGDLFPGTTPLDAHRHLQGFDNKTLEIGRALWQLSRAANAAPAVRQTFLSLPPEQVTAALQDMPEAGEFLCELRAFLHHYGHRSNLWDWGYPSWEDDPAPVIVSLKHHLAQPERDLAAELAQAAVEREHAIAAARRGLTGYPQPVIERFETLLKAAQVALVMTENHTYYIDFNGLGLLHRVIHEFGRRFAAQGRLNRSDDVFYLTLDELREMATRPAADHRELAAARRAESERWAAYDEPRELGTRPAAPLYLYSPDARRVLRYVGGFAAQEPLPEPGPGVLCGQAGASGRARGTARVIHSLAEAHRLQPGDILVTTTTAPPWTPLFLTAAAIVTDAGGLLSHGAVVAREYRIPAVVGTCEATARVQDGQLIEVDGDHGLVHLL